MDWIGHWSPAYGRALRALRGGARPVALAALQPAARFSSCGSLLLSLGRRGAHRACSAPVSSAGADLVGLGLPNTWYAFPFGNCGVTRVFLVTAVHRAGLHRRCRLTLYVLLPQWQAGTRPCWAGLGLGEGGNVDEKAMMTCTPTQSDLTTWPRSNPTSASLFTYRPGEGPIGPEKRQMQFIFLRP